MSRRQLRRFILVSLLSICLPVSVNARPADNDEIEQVLAALGSGSSAELKSRLFAAPLTTLDGAFRAEALSGLPAALREQRVTHGGVLRRVETNFQRVLGLHERPPSAAVEIFVVRDQGVLACLWRGCVLVLSVDLVDTLSDAELSGIIAHELGHSYFMDEMARAQQTQDARSMREIELKCDAVAILSLKLLGDNPAMYLSGLRKLQTMSYRKSGHASGIFQTHPEYVERALFFQRLIKSLG
jgi:Zn-dependent protease with chaperone function